MRRHSDLVRVLPGDVAEQLPYWMVVRPDSIARPAVAAVADAVRARVLAMRDELLGRRSAA